MRNIAFSFLCLFLIGCTADPVSSVDAGACFGDPSCPERGGPEPDAGVCEITDDRKNSCRGICRDGDQQQQLCPGETSPDCYVECVAGVAGVAWCPQQ